jgi:hypothetical protein
MYSIRCPPGYNQFPPKSGKKNESAQLDSDAKLLLHFKEQFRWDKAFVLEKKEEDMI